MPEWLLKKDNYSITEHEIEKKHFILNKEAFIDKSILSFLGVLSKLKPGSPKKSKLNPLIKLIGVIALIILMSVTKSFTYVLISNVMLLVLINFFNVEDIKRILAFSVGIMLFTAIILLPSYIFYHNSNITLVSLKILASVTSVNMLSASTPWEDIIRALKFFRIPDLFIFVIDITIKYIIMLGELALEMLYSLKLRSVGSSRYNSKSTSLTGIMGTMFIKSKEISEEMYNAMECRGFSGEYITQRKINLKILDYGFILGNILFIMLYFYFDRL